MSEIAALSMSQVQLAARMNGPNIFWEWHETMPHGPGDGTFDVLAD